MAVRQAWGLQDHVPVDYEQERFGRFDPLLMAQVRKRLVAVRESWSALTGGDASRLRSSCDQLHALRESLVRLHAPLAGLAARLAEAGVIARILPLDVRRPDPVVPRPPRLPKIGAPPAASGASPSGTGTSIVSGARYCISAYPPQRCGGFPTSVYP